MLDSLPAVTPDTFDQEVLQSDLPVIVDYYAPWCAPCKSAAPFVERLTAEHAGQVKVVKIDCEAHRDWVKTQGLTAVPTIRVYKQGRVVNQAVGAAVLPSLSGLFKLAVQ